MDLDEIKELRRLRDENAKLERLVAEKELEVWGIKEIAKRSC